MGVPAPVVSVRPLSVGEWARGRVASLVLGERLEVLLEDEGDGRATVFKASAKDKREVVRLFLVSRACADSAFLSGMVEGREALREAMAAGRETAAAARYAAELASAPRQSAWEVAIATGGKALDGRFVASGVVSGRESAAALSRAAADGIRKLERASASAGYVPQHVQAMRARGVVAWEQADKPTVGGSTMGIPLVLKGSQAEVLRADGSWWAKVALSAAGKAIRSVELGGSKIGQAVNSASSASLRRGVVGGVVVSLVGDGGKSSGTIRAAASVATDGVTFAGGATKGGGAMVISDASKDDAHLAACAAIASRVERVRFRLARMASGYWCADNDRDGQGAEVARVWEERRGWRMGYWLAARRAAGREVSARALRGLKGRDSELASLPPSLPPEDVGALVAMDSARVAAWQEGEGADTAGNAPGHTVKEGIRRAWRVLVLPARTLARTSEGRARPGALRSLQAGRRAFKLVAGVLLGATDAIATLRAGRREGGQGARHAAAFAAVGGDQARAILATL